MIAAFEIAGFKCFEQARVELGALTVLCGVKSRDVPGTSQSDWQLRSPEASHDERIETEGSRLRVRLASQSGCAACGA